MCRTTATIRSESRGDRLARAFTLVEILFSVLIIGVLTGLLLVGFQASRSYVSSVGARTAASNIKAAVAKFKTEFGFLPPLVRDAATVQRASVVANGANRSKIAVYDFSTAQANPDLTILLPMTLTAPTAANPFEDPRYSDRTLAYYLVGDCNTERNRGETDPTAATLPIDGVPGPGFYPPNPDGTFKVPEDVKSPDRDGTRAANQQTQRVKNRYESFIDLSGKGVSVVRLTGADIPAGEGTSGADPNGHRAVEVVDSNGVPIRFYRWMKPATITGLRDLRLPPLVGRSHLTSTPYPYPIPADRDLEKNIELRDASFAIVTAGPDGAFGDEPDALFMKRLNKQVAAADLLRLRFEAEKDNIVEVGK